MILLARLVAFACLFVVRSSFGAPESPTGLDGVVSAKTLALDETLKRARGSNTDLSPLEAELGRMLAGSDLEAKDLAVGWITNFDGRFSLQEQEKLIRYCLGYDLPATLQSGLLSAIVEIRWKQSTQEERKKIYWDAVRRGTTTIWENRELDRTRALVLAVGEGLEEFASAVRQYGQALDDPRDVSTPKATDRLLWRLRLRAGARDGSDGDRLQASRLSEMSDEDLSRGMNEDSAFKYVTVVFAQSACQADDSASCRAMKDVAARQLKFWEELATETPEPVRPGATKKQRPEWLDRLNEATRGRGDVARMNESEFR